MFKYKIFFFLLSFASMVFAQTDTITSHGTIKISKPKEEGIYIKSYIKFNKYDLSKIKANDRKEMAQQPTPIVESGPREFSYTNYFTQKFLDEGIEGCAYELFPIETINALPQLLQDNPNLCGLNITIPYKKSVISYLHDTGNLPLQACNCIKINDGKN